MILLLAHLALPALLPGSVLTCTVQAQPPRVAVYRVQVVTETGKRFRGTLEYVTEKYLYLDDQRSKRPADFMQYEAVPADLVRKVIIRRVSKKGAITTGAVLGGLAAGFLSNESLQRNRPSGAVAYGLTLTFAAVGGAAVGVPLGAAVGNLSSRVIRPLDRASPGVSLFRQLEPFSVRYQQDFINRLPKPSN